MEKEKKKLSHSDLCKIGMKILKTKLKCTIAIYEPQGLKENPDAIGWRFIKGGRTNGSILIECKTSRSDFKADFKKDFRIKPELGIGNHRYYLCPTNLISIDELPDKWGLIYVNEKGQTEIVKDVSTKPLLLRQNKFEIYNIENERFLLTRWLNRIGDCDKTALTIRELYSSINKLENNLLKLNKEYRELKRLDTLMSRCKIENKKAFTEYMNLMQNFYFHISSLNIDCVQTKHYLNEISKTDEMLKMILGDKNEIL